MPPSVPVALLLAAGLAAGIHVDPALARLPSLVMAAAVAAAFLARAQRLPAVSRLMWAVALLAGAVLHGLHAVDRAEHAPIRAWLEARIGPGALDPVAPRMEEPVRLRARLVRDGALTESGALIQVHALQVSAGGAWEVTEGGVSITVAGTQAVRHVDLWRAGREVELPVLLRRPARYLNEGVPDGERALARRGTALVGTVKSAALVDVRRQAAWWDERAADVRAAVRRAMAEQVGPHAPMSAAIGTAILIGDRAAMSPDVERRLQEAGTYHVVAISGGNIALLAGAALALFWALRVRFAGAAAIAIAVLAAHAWVIGGGASVVRATLMAVIYLGLRLVDQRTAPINALAVGASAMLLANPLDLVNAGFWLTYGATAALIAVAARWPPPRARRWWHAPAAICVGSMAVELVLTPVSAYVFQRVTLAGLLLNLVAVPAMAVVQAAATVCVLLDGLGLARAAGLPGHVTHLAAQALLASGRLVDYAPWAAWRVPSPPLWLVAGYYALIVLWWRWTVPPVDPLERRLRVRGAGALVAALWAWMALVPQVHARAALDTRLRVTMMDVGQGDALLVTFPGGRTLMVDSGGVSPRGEFDIGDRVLGPAIRARGIARLDYLAVTHGDPDHIGGAVSLVRDFAPAEVWAGVFVVNHEPQERLRDAAGAARSAWRWLQRADRFEIGGVEVRVHHPPLPDWERQKVRNDDSLVLELRHGEVSVLLTGDISREVEQQLVPGLDPLPTVILKSPHHGSATSSSARLLAHLRPAAVIISAGRGNPYGHPVPAVLERYTNVGAPVFRTDRDGQIELVTDGHTVEVTTYTGLRWQAH
ncbi:MAG: DNA internalization-related competence protein ComEC/Rec2 [Acidobacteria bacterium]|nr:DNA internalization-related competence protein ComEC/Rec2 [Acidobacteriota bacterium]